MSETIIQHPQIIEEILPKSLPTDQDLPDRDGIPVNNFQEHPQSILLTDTLEPILIKQHTDGNYCIGQDCGIYWRIPNPDENPLRGAISPDWFYVPNVPKMLKGRFRRSYVMWQELIPPFLVIEFVSGDGSEERNTTPYQGKFWIYEQILRIPFYGIFDAFNSSLEFYQLSAGHYSLMPTNEQGRFVINQLGLEFGIWQGTYRGMDALWLRAWDIQGNLLPTGDERTEQERLRTEQERLRAEQAEKLLEEEKNRANKLAEKLRALGIDID